MNKNLEKTRTSNLLLIIVVTVMLSIIFSVTVSAKSLNIDNLSYDLYTLNGKHLSTENHKVRAKILIFGRSHCGRTLLTLKEISESDWIKSRDVAVYYIGIDEDDMENMKKTDKLLRKYMNASLNKKIQVCYEEEGYSSEMWDYIHECGDDGSYTRLPVVVMIDKKDHIRSYFTDYKEGRIEKTIKEFTKLRVK